MKNLNMNLRKQQSGFTLIELVIVIVILGILAAVAIPRFVDLSDEAEAATCAGIKGALSSTGAILIADSTAGESSAGAGDGVGTPGTQANILAGTVQDGWSGVVGSGTCDFDITLTSGGSCTVAINDSLASDC